MPACPWGGLTGEERAACHGIPSLCRDGKSTGHTCFLGMPTSLVLILLLIGDNFSGRKAPHLHGNTSKYSSGDLCSTFFLDLSPPVAKYSRAVKRGGKKGSTNKSILKD